MINVIGLGYIGLPTALMFASKKIKVIGTDYNRNLVANLKKGKLSFQEDGLQELFHDALLNGIQFSDQYQSSDLYIIAVPTPYEHLSKKIDSSFVIQATLSILKVCKADAIIIIESTVSPGTIDKQLRPLVNQNFVETGKKVYLVHAPERIIPGKMIYELSHNSRTIGADTEEIGNRVAAIYRNITQGEIVITSIKAAEMTKVVENTFRAINIAFANELAKICRHDDLDVYEIIRICNMHPRVNILTPGPGVGGHCIPVDPWFLVGDYPELTKLIREALEVNESMPEFVLNRIFEIMQNNDMVDVSRVGIYGLTYKENVSDYRESPSLQLLDRQKKYNMLPFKCYDPWVELQLSQNQYFDLDSFLNDVDLVVIMVKHDEIKHNIEKLKGKIVYDTQNIIQASKTYKL